ncbi:MAG: IclR family transcriptional regulator [Eubacteriales bacterium]|nr:IclR family transcriptional regulator [Eubacteriales bacterium]
MSKKPINAPAPAAYHAVKIIELLAAEKEPLGISEIGRKLDLNINMVFRVLNTLQTCNWVCVDSRTNKYQLTLRPFETTAKSRDSISLYSLAMPLVHQYWEAFGESIILSILKNDACFYLLSMESTRTVRISASVGSSYPLYCSAPGKILLAYSDPAYIEEYTSRPMKKYTENTLADKAALCANLEEIRTCGYALDKEEYGRGIICFAAPIFSSTGEIAAALHSSVLLTDYSIESMTQTLGKGLIETAKEISLALGYRA